jgi:hypothetical protein
MPRGTRPQWRIGSLLPPQKEVSRPDVSGWHPTPRTPPSHGQRRSQAPCGDRAGRVRPPKPAPSPPNPSALPPLPRHELASRHKLSGNCCCDPVCMKGGGTRDSPFPSCTWCGLLLGLTIPGLGLVCCLRQASPPARLPLDTRSHARIPLPSAPQPHPIQTTST